MAYLTKDKVKELINNRPPGTTPEGIIVALRTKGHKLEGYILSPEEKAEKRKGVSEHIAKIKAEPKVGLASVGKFLSGLGGLVGRGLQVPQSVMTIGAETLGAEAGRMLEGDIKGVGAEHRAGLKRIGEIPGQVYRGAEEGFFAEDEMARPSKALGLEGVAGFAVDVLGDPLNLFTILAKGGTQADDVIKATKKSPVLQKFGEKLYQSTLKPSTKDEAKAFRAIGKTLAEPELLGKRLSRYKIKGGLSTMIKKINSRIPALGTKLDDAAKASDKIIDMKPVLDNLKETAGGLRKIGDDVAVKQIDDVIKGMKKTKLSVPEAIDLRRAYDEGRILASGGLSHASSAKQRIYRVVSNGLRKQINKVPVVGELNKEFATYYDSINALTREAAKYSKKLPGLSRFFPWISLRTPLAGVKTTIGQIALTFGKDVLEVRKILTPSVLRNLLKEIGE